MNSDNVLLTHFLDLAVKAQLHHQMDEFLADGGEYCDLGRFSDVRTRTWLKSIDLTTPQSSILMEETDVVKDEQGRGYLVDAKNPDTEATVSILGVLVAADLPP